MFAEQVVPSVITWVHPVLSFKSIFNGGKPFQYKLIPLLLEPSVGVLVYITYVYLFIHITRLSYGISTRFWVGAQHLAGRPCFRGASGTQDAEVIG